MIEAQDIEMIVSLLDADASLRETFRNALFITTSKKVKAEFRTCSYCGKIGVYAKKLCRSCYARMSRNGSPEPKRPYRNLNIQATPWYITIASERIGYIENYVMPPDLKESVEAYINTLPSRTQGCVFGHFRDYKTYQQLGEEYGLSRERIRQIIKKALDRMDSRIITMGNAEIQKNEQRLFEEKRAKEAEKQAKAKEKYQSSLRVEVAANEDMLLREYLISMGCSVRAYNCIVRGLEDSWTLKVSDFLDFIFNEKQGNFTEYFWMLRNCGRKTAMELTNYFVEEEENAQLEAEREEV